MPTPHKIKDLRNWHMNLLIYGDPGVGKTVFCASALGLGKTLVLDVEGGMASIRNTDIDVVDIESMSDLNVTYEMLSETKHGYTTVCIDNLTELQRIITEDVLEGSGKDTPAVRDWGVIRERIIRIIRYFRDLDANLIVTCHVTAERDEDERMFRSPDLVGKLKKQIAGFFDEVGYMFVDTGEGSFVLGSRPDTEAEEGEERGGTLERRILFQLHPQFVAKDRGGMLDKYESADFAAIYEKTFGATKPQTKLKKRGKKK
jgi:phage nucleotide-binding protein